MTAPSPAASLACELIIEHQGPEEMSIHFVLTNRTGAPATIHYYLPFMQFDVRVTAGGVERSISQPAIDLPVQPADLTLPIGGRGTLETPIRLRFASQPAVPPDSFVWTIAGEPAPIEVRATIKLDGIAIPPCTARF